MKTDRRGFLKALAGTVAGVVGGVKFIKVDQMIQPDSGQPDSGHAEIIYEGFSGREVGYVISPAIARFSDRHAQLSDDRFLTGSVVSLNSNSGKLELCDLSNLGLGVVAEIYETVSGREIDVFISM